MSRSQLPIVSHPDPGTVARAPDPEGHPEARLQSLLGALAEYAREGAVVAFSGGVDSAFLLWAAREAAGRDGRVVALTTVSASTPPTDLAEARRYAEDLAVEHVVRESRELESAEYVRNDRERCYHCKADLFRIAREVAEARGLEWILYGYTASDHGDVRPGHRAAVENGVVAPLSDHGLGKDGIRALMRARGLDLADKPASPCLSSRLMTGVGVTRQRLADVEALEAILRRAGVRVHRARICAADVGHFVRIEVAAGEMSKVLECRAELEREGRERGYRWVTLDLGGYRTGGGTA